MGVGERKGEHGGLKERVVWTAKRQLDFWRRRISANSKSVDLLFML